MKKKHHTSRAAVPTIVHSRQTGLTLTEVIAGIFLVALLATVGYKMYQNQREKEELLDCMTEVRGVHASVMGMAAGGSVPGLGELWEMASTGGTGRGEFFCVVDNTAGRQAGATNRGNHDASAKDTAAVVVFCQHDHGALAKYVYVTDDGRPKIASDGNDPGYQSFISRENGGPGKRVGVSD